MKVIPALKRRRAEIERAIVRETRNFRPKGSYKTIWRKFEREGIRCLQAVLPFQFRGKQVQFDVGKKGQDKNRKADLVMSVGAERLKLSIKSARAGKNPENDLGTFLQFRKAATPYAAPFELWFRYEKQGPVWRVDRVFFDEAFKFVGKMKVVDGVKYRKKDGNMRPAPWERFEKRKPYWSNQKEFHDAVWRSIRYRANSLVEEHLRDMTEKAKRALLNKLRKQLLR